MVQSLVEVNLVSCEFEDFSTIGDDIELASFILPKGCDPLIRLKQQLILPFAACFRLDKPPDETRTVISIEIDSIPLGHGPAIDKSTGH